MYISAPHCDEFVNDAVRAVLAPEGGIDLVSNARELEAARAASERARQETEAFVKLSSAIDAEHFQAGYAERHRAEAEAAQRYDELVAVAADADDLPTDVDAYDALTLVEQRRIAKSLIARIVVNPPSPRRERRPVEERLALQWRRHT
jgi:hypothetical protein